MELAPFRPRFPRFSIRIFLSISAVAADCARLRNRPLSRNKSLRRRDPIPEAPEPRINTSPRKFAHLPSRVNEAIVVGRAPPRAS